MAKTFEKTHVRRIVAMALLSVLLFLLATVRLFQYQVVDGAKYAQEADSGRTTTVPVEAARGEIVDRNGIPFTKNKAVFTVQFDFTMMDKTGRNRQTLDNDAANDTIYRLIQVFEERGETWLDNLPVTMEAPYEFSPDAAESAVSRLRTNMGVNSYATAEDCIYHIFRDASIKKYQEDGKCTHCGQPFDQCEYEGYTEEYARKIAGVRYEMILKQFSVDNTRFTFAEDVSPETVSWLKEQSAHFKGVTIVEKAMRTYVGGDVASHLIGRVGPIYKETWETYKQKNKEQGTDYTMNDTVGQAGIESAMEDILRGKNGEMTVRFNSDGEVMGSTETTAPVAGRTVQLTIDYGFQQDLQKLLSDYIANFNESATAKKQEKHSEAAAIVVTDLTGGVLACVSYPYFDILDYINNYNDVLHAEGNPLFNRALQGLYSPGSSFKPVVAAGALMEGFVEPDTDIYCSRVYEYYAPSYMPKCLGVGGHFYHDLNVSQALQYSCNIFFFDTGRRMGIDLINQYAQLFGYGMDTGLEIGNAKGRLTTKEDSDWQAGNVVQAAIGQKNTQVTPLQMASEAATLANRGTRYQSHLVKAVLDNDGKNVLSVTQPKVLSQFELNEEYYSAIANGMTDAARSISYPNQVTDFAGGIPAIKTGSPETGRYDSLGVQKTNNDFIAFYPEENPEIAISCLVEDGYNSNQLLRGILLAWEKAKNGGTLPEEYQPKDSDSSGTASGAVSGTSSENEGESTSAPAASLPEESDGQAAEDTSSAPSRASSG